MCLSLHALLTLWPATRLLCHSTDSDVSKRAALCRRGLPTNIPGYNCVTAVRIWQNMIAAQHSNHSMTVATELLHSYLQLGMQQLRCLAGISLVQWPSPRPSTTGIMRPV